MIKVRQYLSIQFITRILFSASQPSSTISSGYRRCFHSPQKTTFMQSIYRQSPDSKSVQIHSTFIDPLVLPLGLINKLIQCKCNISRHSLHTHRWNRCSFHSVILHIINYKYSTNIQCVSSSRSCIHDIFRGTALGTHRHTQILPSSQKSRI